jgi:DNA-directed RNA polymerase subunit H (RpoH/RPB5)
MSSFTKLTFTFGIFITSVIFSFNTMAQYGGGYGGGYGGAGGFGNRSGIPQAGQGMETRRPDNSLDPEKISTEETRWMTKKLKLTEEQLPKVEDVNIKYAFKRFDIFEEIKKITANGTVAPTEDFRIKIKEKMLKMKADKDKELKDILTPEQFELYQKKRTDK